MRADPFTHLNVVFSWAIAREFHAKTDSYRMNRTWPTTVAFLRAEWIKVIFRGKTDALK